MGRKPKAQNVYDKIAQMEAELSSLQSKMDSLKSQLKELYAERDDLEVKKVLQTIRDNGINIDDLQKIIDKTVESNNSEE